MTFLLGGDLIVDRLGFGAMRLAQNGWDGPARDPKVAVGVLRRALELGVDHIDTADFYRSGDGAVHANTLIREALHPYAPGLVIATKVGPSFGPNGPFYGPASGLRAQVEANLKALGVDRLDLVYLRVGMMTPPHGESIAERFEVLAKLRDEGLIRHLGLSNVDAQHLDEARAIAPVAAVQNSFHIAKRPELDVLVICEAHRIAFVPYGPIGGGHDDLHLRKLADVAARYEAGVQQIALAWLLAFSPVTLAIPGTGSISHLEENVSASTIRLTSDDFAELTHGFGARESAHGLELG
ncbi:aldo/keto reductase [Dyella sp. LX-66]|nr:aldo/keto reductase [Dyella sp. LX-1]MBT2140077.1 aldo/keto reductase [Dyella sp. LX-66]